MVWIVGERLTEAVSYNCDLELRTPTSSCRRMKAPGVPRVSLMGLGESLAFMYRPTQPFTRLVSIVFTSRPESADLPLAYSTLK